jgi:hypothetical protein
VPGNSPSFRKRGLGEFNVKGKAKTITLAATILTAVLELIFLLTKRKK